MSHSEPDRTLWAAVVAQALEDVAWLPMNAAEYDAAEAFLTSPSAYWRRGREEVADHLGVDGDAILRMGRLAVLARRRKEGLPDRSSAPARPVIEAKPVIVVPTELVKELSLRHERRPKSRWAGRNPFNPFRDGAVVANRSRAIAALPAR